VEDEGEGKERKKEITAEMVEKVEPLNCARSFLRCQTFSKTNSSWSGGYNSNLQNTKGVFTMLT
jgi:hypothetical protein